MPKKTEVSGDTKTAAEGAIGEIGKQPVEPVSENDFVDAAKLEEFMNQKLQIMVAEDNSRDALPVITPSVNGVNQPIQRGKKVWVKRKYVEALARGKYSRYEQKVQDPTNPANIQMVEKKAHSYPFSVYQDPHPNGQAWLDALLREQ